MSGGEPSSIKRCFSCAVRLPDLSRLPEKRAYSRIRLRVCSLVKSLLFFREVPDVSGFISEVAATDF